MTPRQTAERPDRAGQPRHLQGGQTAKHRLLSEDTDRVRHRRKDGEHDPEQVDVTGATRRRPDQHCSGERDGGTDQQPARKALAQHDAGQQSNQDRADVDQHGCRPGVEVLLGRIECDVVDGEPGHAAHAQQHPLPAVGSHPPPACQQQRTERSRAECQPSEGERAGGEGLTGPADHHEGRGPGQDGRGDGGEDGHVARSGWWGHSRGAHCRSVDR